MSSMPNMNRPAEIRAGVGMSHHRSTMRAAQEAVRAAQAQAGIDQPDFVFVFATLGYEPEQLLQTIRQATGNAPLVGCSGQGVITQGEADESSFALAVMVIQSDQLRFTHRAMARQNQSFAEVGEILGSKLQMAMPDSPLALFLFTDGLSLNFERFAAGLQSSLGLAQPLPLLGGAAGSDAEMKVTYQFCDDRVYTDGTVVALMSGQAKVAWAVNHGCVPIGTAHRVTRCDGNKIYELNDRPVFEVLRQYLTDEEIEKWDRTIVSFCFGLKATDDDQFLIRCLPQKDERAGTVMLQTEVLEGTDIWVMRRDQEKICQGIQQVAQDLNDQLAGVKPKLVFQFDCYGRGRSVFTTQQNQQLLQRLQTAVGADIPWLGFYSHGEIAPIGQTNTFHNYTIALTAIYA
jgi:hypothetical protein